MSKNVKNNPAPINSSLSKEEAIKGVQYPVYVRIADDDTLSFSHYKKTGIPVARFPLAPGLPAHHYAIHSASSAEEAETLNRFYNKEFKSEDRQKAKRAEHETSYEAILESGIDISAGGYADPEKHQVPDFSQCCKNDPAGIAEYNALLGALADELDKLTSTEKTYCKMVAHKIPERTVAQQLNKAQTTINSQKNKMLGSLRENLKHWK